ncbi:expressed unknown protein [Seminavis robusta]|uniref:Methyltransferase FkbM domain-containing protein n=1 Tax=Seminavis robusta TaxID=568900 RepID=A0A9N8EFE1_9STRA|nr:expressed unknown protein [Seminavis robusta]|eukprot:Sro1072_g238030.1 n/a (415) ;mRNA; r:6736-7980
MPKVLRPKISRKKEPHGMAWWFVRWVFLGLCAVGIRHVYLSTQETQGRYLRAFNEILDHPTYHTTQDSSSAVASSTTTTGQVGVPLIPTNNPSSPLIRNALLQIQSLSADNIWDSLVQEAAALMKNPPAHQQQQETTTAPPRFMAMEVGMFRAKQCFHAARMGLEAHCIEPSPHAFQRITQALRKEPVNVQTRIHLYNNAAAALPGLKLNFSAGGSPGDHVGSYDVWKMQAAAGAPPTQVDSIRLDDLIGELIPQKSHDKLFVLKVDTQGYEPSVFAGLEHSVFLEHRVDYVMFEYWPKGMDLLTTGDVHKRSCVAHLILQALHEAGYTLYALPNTAHPRAPKEALEAIVAEQAPMNNFQENCLYYYQVEDRFSTGDYKMGYWSDMLAVAPGASLLQNPVTEVGQILQQQKRLT